MTPGWQIFFYVSAAIYIVGILCDIKWRLRRDNPCPRALRGGG